MKKILVILSLFLCVSQAYAYDYNPMETVQEARARHSAENYSVYQQQRSAPLGGYSTKLGDPSPRGTINPGYMQPVKIQPLPTYQPFMPTLNAQSRRPF